MKTTKFKAFLILLGLMLLDIPTMSAGVVNKIQKFACEQISSFNARGFLLIGGIIAASLIIYVITNHLMKDKEEDLVGQNNHVNGHNHHRHHHVRHIAKKTS